MVLSMKSGQMRRDQQVKNTTIKNTNGALSKAPRRKILGSVSANTRAAPSSTKPSSKQPSSRISPNIAQKKPRIPATDPKQISVLWQRVMAQRFNQPTQASKAKAKSPSGQGKQAGISETTYPTSARTSTITSSSRSAGITIDNPAFRDLILLPRRISIDSEPLSRSAFQHFCTSPPTRYQDIDGLTSTTVWLEGDDRFKTNIVNQYKEMKDWGLCEAEYAQYSLEHLLKSEVRDPDAVPSRAWNTKRMIQLVAKPERLWKSPPIIDTPPTKDYNFDVRPDCSYWIPIDVFNDRYQNLVMELTFVKYTKILCPYLSIEFKKDDSKQEKAESQVAVAGSIALYNRFKLKEKRLRRKNKNWTERRLANIRHYGITFRAEAFTVWCIRPNKPQDIGDTTTETWTGCIMGSVHKNGCNTMVGVQNLMEWINEIHRWGLTVHGDSCQRDVQHCIEADELARTSLGEAQSLQDSDTDLEPEPEALS